MPESQRSRNQHQKATDTEKHPYVSPHTQQYSSFDNGSSNPHPLQTIHPRKFETFSWRTQSVSNFWPLDQKEKKEKQNNTATQTTALRLAVFMLFSLQRQDLLFWSLSQGDHIAAPQILQTGVFKTLGFLTSSFFFQFPREYLGWKAFYPWPPLRCPLSNGCLVSLQKFWSQCLGGLSTKWGPGTQSISCKNLAH